MPDIRLPDGRIIKNIPEGMSKAQVTETLVSKGVLTGSEDFLQQSQPDQQIQPGTKPQQDSATGTNAPQRDFGRSLGLGARTVLQGVASPVTLLGDLTTMGLNAATGTNTQLPSQAVSEGLTAIGLPKPETAQERIIGAVGEAATGSGTAAAGLRTLTKAPKFLKAISSTPAREAAAGAGAGLATSVGREAGGVFESTPAQIALGLLGGAAGGRGFKPKQTPIPKESLLSDLAESGIDDVQAFSRVRTPLIKEATRQKELSNQLFETAKKRGKNASIAKEDVAKLSTQLQQEINNVIDIDGKNFLSSTSKSIDALSDFDIADTVNRLQSFRRQASTVVMKDKVGSEGAKRVLEKIDSFLEEVDITGDSSSVKLWNDAIRTRREFGAKFEKPTKIAKAIDESNTIEDIGKEFIGTGSVASKTDLAQVYEDTLRALPTNQSKEAGFALRQSVFNQLVKNAARGSDSADGLSASRLSNSIKNLRRENKSFWDKYNPEEKKILSALERDLRKTAEGGAINKAYSAAQKLISKA